MEKEFKRNIGDKVWVMNNNKPRECVISRVSYALVKSSVDFETIIERESYYLDDIGYFDVDVVFDTKEDLIRSL